MDINYHWRTKLRRELPLRFFVVFVAVQDTSRRTFVRRRHRWMRQTSRRPPNLVLRGCQVGNPYVDLSPAPRRGFFVRGTLSLLLCWNSEPNTRHETQLKLFFAFDETRFVERVFLSSRPTD
jgi:hypothetical protein